MNEIFFGYKLPETDDQHKKTCRVSQKNAPFRILNPKTWFKKRKRIYEIFSDPYAWNGWLTQKKHTGCPKKRPFSYFEP